MFSVIVPIYKVEKYIEECIRSLVLQSFRDFELVLVDDGSPDDSVEIAERVLKSSQSTEYRIIRTENRGVSAARNTGIDNSRGEYIVMVDSDDILSKDFLLDFKRKIDSYPESDIISCGFEIIREDVKKETTVGDDKTLVCDHFVAQKHFFDRTIKFLLPALAIKKDFIERNKIRFDEAVRYSEDVQFIWRCLAYNQKDIVHFTKENYKYILHPGSTMTASGIEKILTFCGGIERLYEEISPLLRDDIRNEIVQRMYFSMLHGASKMMSYRTFKDLYIRSRSKRYVKEQFHLAGTRVRVVCVIILVCLRMGYAIMRKF